MDGGGSLHTRATAVRKAAICSPLAASLRDPAAAADHRAWQENTPVIKLIALMTS